MLKGANMPRNAVVCLIVAAILSVPMTLAAQATAKPRDLNCRVVGAISHRCYTFHSDATWREGLPDYHGSQGG